MHIFMYSAIQKVSVMHKNWRLAGMYAGYSAQTVQPV